MNSTCSGLHSTFPAGSWLTTRPEQPFISKDLYIAQHNTDTMSGIGCMLPASKSPLRRGLTLEQRYRTVAFFSGLRLGLTYLHERSVMHRVREIEPLQPRFFNTPLSSFISSCYYLVTNNLLLFSNMLLTIAEKEGLYPQKIVNNPITRDHAS